MFLVPEPLPDAFSKKGLTAHPMSNGHYISASGSKTLQKVIPLSI
jgi:hypothetical protein